MRKFSLELGALKHWDLDFSTLESVASIQMSSVKTKVQKTLSNTFDWFQKLSEFSSMFIWQNYDTTAVVARLKLKLLLRYCWMSPRKTSHWIFAWKKFVMLFIRQKDEQFSPRKSSRRDLQTMRRKNLPAKNRILQFSRIFIVVETKKSSRIESFGKIISSAITENEWSSILQKGCCTEGWHIRLAAEKKCANRQSSASRAHWTCTRAGKNFHGLVV